MEDTNHLSLETLNHQQIAHPSLFFFRQCIQKGIIQPEEVKKYPYGNDTYWIGKIPDIHKFKTEEAIIRQKYLPEYSILQYDDFDWGHELPKSLRAIIRFIWSKNLLARDDLVSTSRFAGPGNIEVKESVWFGSGGAEFDYRDYHYKKFDFEGFGSVMEGTTFLPPPENRNERNAGIKIYITPFHISATAQ